MCDPGDRQGSYAAGLEFEPGVGHVFVAAEHRQPQRLDPPSGAADEREHQVDVVDHQVQHDAHVHRAEGEGARSAPPRCSSAGGGGGDCGQGRVEPLDVAHLEHRSWPVRASRINSSASSAVAASGFSTSRWVPASRKSRARAWCSRVGEAITAASICPTSDRCSPSAAVLHCGQAVAGGPGSRIDHGHRARRGGKPTSLWAWNPPSRPAPITATRRSFQVAAAGGGAGGWRASGGGHRNFRQRSNPEAVSAATKLQSSARDRLRIQFRQRPTRVSRTDELATSLLASPSAILLGPTRPTSLWLVGRYCVPRECSGFGTPAPQARQPAARPATLRVLHMFQSSH